MSVMSRPLEKVNWGVMPEIPGVCINNFAMEYIEWTSVKAFFMTHVDKDLVVEVLNPDFLTKLLASPEDTTRLYMHAELLKYLHFWISTNEVPDQEKDVLRSLLTTLVNEEKLVGIRTKVTLELIFSEQKKTVEVSPMYAGHDVGAVMLLFEKIDAGASDALPRIERILYTGNCRIIQKDRLHLRPLFYDDFCTIAKTIHKVYIDTTFCVRSVEELPPRGTVTFALIDEIAALTREDPVLRIEFASLVKGGLCRLFDHVAHELCQQIHVPETLKKYWARIPDLGVRVSCKSDKERGEFGNLHYGCGEEHDNENCIGPQEDWGITYDAMEMQVGCHSMIGKSPFQVSDDVPSDEVKPFWTHGSPTVIKTSSTTTQILYASNLSRFELGRFLKALDVKSYQVVPLYKPKSLTLEEVQDLIKETIITVGPEPGFFGSAMRGFWFDLSNKFDDPSCKLYDSVGEWSSRKVYRHDGGGASQSQ